MRHRLQGPLFHHAVALLATLALAACGGGGSSAPPDPAQAYAQRVAAADEAASAAKSLVSAGPCADSSQCGVLALDPTGHCTAGEYIPYSLVAPNAQAASAAAAKQRDLAQQAAMVQPPDNLSCTITTRFQFPLCSANRCQF